MLSLKGTFEAIASSPVEEDSSIWKWERGGNFSVMSIYWFTVYGGLWMKNAMEHEMSIKNQGIFMALHMERFANVAQSLE